MTIVSEKIEDARASLNKYAAEKLSDDELVPRLYIDALVTPETLDLKLLEQLAMFEPFGQGNPKPVFLTRDMILSDEPYVMKDKHLKMRPSRRLVKQFEAVWWDGVERSKGQTLKPNSRIELAYIPEANSWQGATRLATCGRGPQSR